MSDGKDAAPLLASAAAPVSVLIPCHNNAGHIAAAIGSALAQSCPPAQVIVIDDGSSDDSCTIIGRFGDRVQLVKQPNRGAAAARNTGVRHATGALIAFLDGDDAWPIDSLAIRLAELERSGADLVYGGVRQCIGSVGDDAPALGGVIAGRLAGAMLVRRDVFLRVGMFDKRLTTAETIDWVARAQALGVSEAVCAATVLFRRIHGANMMLRTAAPAQDCLGVLREVVRRRKAGTA